MTEPGWMYFIGRTLIKFEPNHDGTILRFYFDNGIKLTATAKNEDDKRDEPWLVLGNYYDGPHALSAALKLWSEKNMGGMKIDNVLTHEIPDVEENPDGTDHSYIHARVMHRITLRGTTPFYATRESKTKRIRNSEYTLKIIGWSDTFVDDWPGWDWSIHDVLFLREGG